MTAHTIFACLAVGASLGAAALWFYASLLRIPTDIKSGWGALVGVEEMTAGFKRQSFWNAVAAVLTGAALLFDLIARYTGT